VCIYLARPAGFEPATLGLAYHYSFHCRKMGSESIPVGAGINLDNKIKIDSNPFFTIFRLWSGPSLHHFRCCTYGLYGSHKHCYRLLKSPLQWQDRGYNPSAPGFLGITISPFNK